MTSSYGSSSLTGYDFTRIKTLTAGLYIGLPENPSDGDTIYYDAATQTWIAGAPASSSLPIFSAYDGTGDITIGTSATDLTYGTEVKKDSIYTHTTGSGGITVTHGGLYYISADVGVYVSSGSTASYVDAFIAKNGTELAGTRGTVATNATSSRGSITISRVLSLAANDVIKVRGILNTSGNTAKTIANSSRMTIVQITDTGSSTTSGAAMGAGIFSYITYP